MLDSVSALGSPGLPLYPFLFFFVGRLPEGLVVLCLPLCPFLFPFVGWCIRLSEILASLCLPLCPFLFPCFRWCVRLSEGLVLLCLPLCPFLCYLLLDGLSAFLRVLSPLVSHCAPSYFPVLDVASAFSRVLSPFVGHCTPSCSFSPLWSPIVSDCFALFPTTRVPVLEVCPPFQGLVSPSRPCFPTCVPVLHGVSALPRTCLRLSPIFSDCVTTCSTVLDGLSPLFEVLPLLAGCLRCLPLSPRMCACRGWCARLHEVLSALVSHFPRTCVPVLTGVSAFMRPGLPCLPACFPSCPSLSPSLSPLHVSLCHFAFFPRQYTVS